MAWPKNARLGKKHSAATRRKISLATRRAMNRPSVKVKMHNKKISTAHRKKLSIAHTGKKASSVTRAKMSVAQRKRIASGRVFSSKLEARGRLILKKFGLDKRVYLEGYHFDGGDKRRKIVVEIDGCWIHDHRCTGRVGHPDAKTNDRRRRRVAKQFGYKLIILRECKEHIWKKSLQRRIDNGFIKEMPPEGFEE